MLPDVQSLTDVSLEGNRNFLGARLYVIPLVRSVLFVVLLSVSLGGTSSIALMFAELRLGSAKDLLMVPRTLHIPHLTYGGPVSPNGRCFDH